MMPRGRLCLRGVEVVRLFFAAAWSFILLGAAPLSGPPWHLRDFVSIATFDDVAPSVDGRSFTFRSVRTDLANAWYSYQSYAVDSHGLKGPVATPDRDPDLSPDESWSVHIDESDAQYKLSITKADGAESKTLVAPPVFFHLDSPAWSPNGKEIAYIRDDWGDHRPGWAYNAVAIDPLDDRDEATDTPQRHVWVVDVASGRTRLLTSDDYTYGDPDKGPSPAWSRDGRYIIMSRRKFGVANERFRQWITIDVHTGATHVIPTSETCSQELWSPESDAIAAVCAADDHPLGRRDGFVDGHDVTSSIDHDVLDVAWAGRDSIIARIQDGMASRLYLCRLGASPIPLTPADEFVQPFVVDQAEGTLAYVSSTETHPEEGYVEKLDGSGRVQVTHVNAGDSLPTIIAPRVIEWKNKDGETLQGLVFALPGASRATPLFVYAAGFGSGFNFGFDPIAQYFASNGYTVFEPNTRGSDTYGAWSRRSIVRDWAVGPSSDIEAGISAVVRLGLADPRKQYLFGELTGAYMAAWMDSHTDQFRAVVSGFGFTDIPMFYALSDHAYLVDEYFGDAPLARASALLAQQSPSTYVDRIRTPTMFLAEFDDKAAPIEASFPTYRRLVDRGVPTEFWRYLDNQRPEESLEVCLQVARWFARFGGPKVDDAVPSGARAQRWIGDP